MMSELGYRMIAALPGRALLALALLAAMGGLELFRLFQSLRGIRPTPRVAGAARKAPMNVSNAWQHLCAVQEMARACGARPFLVSGTLLGLHRNGALLPHDSDVDLGIHADDPALPAYIGMLSASPLVENIRRLRVPALTRLLNPWMPRLPDDCIVYKIRFRGEPGSVPLKLDLFVHFAARGFVAHGSSRTIWINNPFTLAEFEVGGVRFFAPADRRRYLAENYGDFETPRIDFESFVDCPNSVNIYTLAASGKIAANWQRFRATGDAARLALTHMRVREFLSGCVGQEPAWAIRVPLS